MYYSVLGGHIPKIKFVAGDKTGKYQLNSGYGVFFTNFCPGMRVGTVLDMYRCSFHFYRGSL